MRCELPNWNNRVDAYYIAHPSMFLVCEETVLEKNAIRVTVSQEKHSSLPYDMRCRYQNMQNIYRITRLKITFISHLSSPILYMVCTLDTPLRQKRIDREGEREARPSHHQYSMECALLTKRKLHWTQGLI